jgi:transcriptional regulator with XRE-family HTH domain
MLHSLNLKQNEIAKEIGVSPSYYYKVESGYQNPSYEFLAKFKRRFPDASIDVLFF